VWDCPTGEIAEIVDKELHLEMISLLLPVSLKEDGKKLKKENLISVIEFNKEFKE
jgi:hypothetical protein